jgi:hypothetical protein
MATGMFDTLNASLRAQQRTEDSDEQQNLQFMAADPDRARAMTAYGMAGLAGKGLAQVGSVAAGLDPRSRTERSSDARNAAADELKAAVVGLTPGTDEYFKKVIEVLTKHGLVDQANAIQEKWEASKLNTARTGAYARQGVPAPLKGKDALLAKYDDLAAKLQDDPDNEQLQGALANVETALKKFYPEKTVNPPKTHDWQVIPETATSPGYRFDRLAPDGNVQPLAGRIAPQPKPLTAQQQLKADEAWKQMKAGYEAAALKTQADYEAAVELFNSPDLEGAVGAFNSAISDTNPSDRGFMTRLFAKTKSPGELRAAALISTVKAGAFLTGFQEIKTAAQAAGAKGAGFGALSDAEGARIQAAKASLDAVQDGAGFRIGLKKYIEQMIAYWNAVSADVETAEIAPKPLREIPLTGGVRGRQQRTAPRTPAAPAPAPAAPAAPAPEAPKGREERWERKDGNLQRVG